MEGYTRRACRHIVARSPIELYPAGVPPDPSIHPSLQKAFYGHLLESLGIDKLMLHFPGMYALKTQNADPVSHMVEARTLEDLMSLRFDAPVLTDDVTVFAEEIPRGAARGYLTGKGMVEERRLTDEGIAAVRSICSIVPYIAVSYHAGKYPLLTAELNLPARPQLAAGWLA